MRILSGGAARLPSSPLAALAPRAAAGYASIRHTGCDNVSGSFGSIVNDAAIFLWLAHKHFRTKPSSSLTSPRTPIQTAHAATTPASQVPLRPLVCWQFSLILIV